MKGERRIHVAVLSDSLKLDNLTVPIFAAKPLASTHAKRSPLFLVSGSRSHVWQLHHEKETKKKAFDAISVSKHQ